MTVAAAAVSVWTNSLSFSMQTQLQTQWCWAATSASVSHFYDSNSAFTQCSIVNNQLGQNSCCTDGSTNVCNTPFTLHTALQYTGNLDSIVYTAPTFEQVSAEIAAGHVVCARIGWYGGGGHFLALSAVDIPNARVHVCDPLNGISDYAFSDFVKAYRGMGTCTTGYLTHPSAAAALGGGAGPAPAVLPIALSEHLRWASARLLRATKLRQAFGTSMTVGSSPFRVYFIGLADAAQPGALDKAKFIGYQSIVEDPVAQSAASIEVNVGDDGAPSGSPHMTHGPFARAMAAQMREVSDVTHSVDFQEYRYLKIPALQISAMWILFRDHDGVVIPLSPTPAPLQSGRRYSAEEFESAIQPLAQRSLSFSDDAPRQAP